MGKIIGWMTVQTVFKREKKKKLSGKKETRILQYLGGKESEF